MFFLCGADKEMHFTGIYNSYSDAFAQYAGNRVMDAIR